MDVASPRPPAQPVSPAPGLVQAVTVDSTLTLLVHGRLDAAAGAALLDSVRTGRAPGVNRLEVDLRDVGEFTDDGADCLVGVRELGVGLAHGVHYRTTAGAGADALLVAFASADDDAAS
ncbi:MAG: hypothetical protein ACRD0A_17375 [Acidimicrobiales bacterium]